MHIPNDTVTFYFSILLKYIMSQVASENIREFQWTISKLVEMGVKESWISKATPSQARDMLKGLLYLKEWCKYSRQS